MNARIAVVVYPSLILILLALFLVSLLMGSVAIAPADVIRILLGFDVESQVSTTMILQLRLPESVTAVLAGSALAVSGLQMQALFRNPLAGPFVLGINAGASLGVAVVVLGAASGFALFEGVFGTGANSQGLGTVGAAILGAGSIMGLVLLVSQRIRDNVSLLILGLMFGYGASALVSFLVYFSTAENIQSYMLWSMGSFTAVAPGQLPVLAGVVGLGLVLAVGCIKSMNAMLLGEDYAQSLGVSIGRSRFCIIVSTALLAGGVTAFCGPVAFLGLAVPHLCRGLLVTADQRILLPAVILMGGILALFSDIVARVPGADETLPLNSVTALIGAPVVVWVILQRRKMKVVT